MTGLESRLTEAAELLDGPEVLRIVDEIIRRDMPRRAIFECIKDGTAAAVRRYEAGEYFISDLIMAGVLYSEAVSRVMDSSGTELRRGRVVCGTVRGDLHELGKNIVVGILECNGYEVIDLGVSVEPKRFVEAVRHLRPHALILSGLLDLSVVEMERAISLLEDNGLRDGLTILLGGVCVTREQSEALGADGYIENFVDCLRLCEEAAGGSGL